MALLTRILGAISIIMLLAGAGKTAYADSSLQLLEQKIKAGLLYNFIKYTRWPAGSDVGSTNVCVYGDDLFEHYIRPMQGRTVNYRTITLKTIDNVSESDNCHIIYISKTTKTSWEELSKFLEKKHILTVSDFSGFADSGGMIEFNKKDHKIGAMFNMQAFEKAGLHVDEALLKLNGVEQLASGRGH